MADITPVGFDSDGRLRRLAADETVAGTAATSHTHASDDIVSGNFDAARIPSLDAVKIATGTIAKGVLPGDLVYTDSTDAIEAVAKKLQESAGPTTLTMGAVADGEYLRRSGTTIVGGGGGAWELVEAKTITADATTVTFSGLDGDADEAYMLVWSIKNATAALRIAEIRPNGATTSFTSTIVTHTTTTAVYNASTTALQIARVASNAVQAENMGWLVMHAAKSHNGVARRRIYHGQGTQSNSAGGNLSFGVWDETSTNITSLEITTDAASAIGNGSRFALYKLVTA